MPVGDFAGKSVQGAAGAGSLDPAKVDVGSGIVKYEMYRITFYNKDTGGTWDANEAIANPGVKAGQELYGTALVQMLEDRKIKFEVFPEKNAAEISAFTENAFIYVR